jgi:Leucine-rich repeat (LRR) protein
MSLYRAALDLLLERRDAGREIPSAQTASMDSHEKVELLQHLAWRLSINNRSELPRDTAVKRIDEKLRTMPNVSRRASEVLDSLLERSGVIREPVRGRVDFVHRTFQEYLTAKEAAEEDDIDLLIERAHLDTWRDTIILAAGHANSPLRHTLVAGILDRADKEPRHRRRLKLLAASCLETATSLAVEVRSRTELALESLLPPRGLAEAPSLAAVGEQVLRHLPRQPASISEAAAAATVLTAALINGPAAIPVIESFGTDSRSDVVSQLIRCWDYFEPNEYARRVLAHSPLHDGRMSIRSPAKLESVAFLSNLARLSVTLDLPTDLELLKEMPALWSLNLQSKDHIDVGLLQGLDSLENLRLSTDRRILRLNLLNKFPRLHTLSCHQEYPLRGFAFLEKLEDRLVSLDLEGPCTAEDYSIFSRMPRLDTLRLQASDALRDLSFIASMKQLKSFSLRAPKLDGDLSILTDGFSSLKDLAFYGGNVQDLRPVSTLSLEDLIVTNNPIQTLAPVGNLHQLAMATFGFCRQLPDDLSPLGECPELFWLDFEGCVQVSDIRVLSRLTKLQSLYLEGTAVRDLSPLASLPRLRRLALARCPHVKDLSPLASIRSLRSLDLQAIDNVLDLSPFRSMRLAIQVSTEQELRGVDRLGSGVALEFQ